MGKKLLLLILLILGLFNIGSSEAKIDDPIIKEKASLYGDVYFGESGTLGRNYIGYKSDYNIPKTSLVSNCFYKSDFLTEKDMVFIFEIEFIEECKNPYVELYYKGDRVPGSKLFLNSESEFKLINYYTDFSTYNLYEEIKKLSAKRKEVSFTHTNTPLKTSVKLRKLKEFDYKVSLIERIIEKRGLKYIVPVFGETLPEHTSYLPNAGRPYRQKYTDGVHHGRDIYAEIGRDVVALDDGIIIRIVSGFEFDDLDTIDYKSHTHDTYTDNLDILRGNQVWLKTMKGDVVFYSHLSQVAPNIKVGNVVSRGETLGKIGKSGVPDKNYKDIHLHFEVQKNPYNKYKYGNYSEMDIMNWDWYFKGESFETIIEKQKEIFNY